MKGDENKKNGLQGEDEEKHKVHEDVEGKTNKSTIERKGEGEEEQLGGRRWIYNNLNGKESLKKKRPTVQVVVDPVTSPGEIDQASTLLSQAWGNINMAKSVQKVLRRNDVIVPPFHL